ncbi:TonB-dependent receptor [Flavobacterium terrae]|uniref:Outer membrane receptor proteins, mostly Fe transport n=1 Tax=Flavobacterium terrae TaxID=415425 RepID=A0A1M6AIG8_9FLAO|nr:TonB-dependent receptor [Flavobacterium terrae]SHI36276.1 Outer membrane receptor proteins, mostly Fe transport [Flavobacterium terrae]
MRMYFTILSLFFCALTFAQNTISGSVTDANSQPVAGANVKVVGASTGTSCGFDGKFTLKTSAAFPFTIEVSMMGYSAQTLEVSSKEQEIVVVLSEESTSLNEIVVSASRAPERVLESPVTIERMGPKEIKNTTAATFYDGLENLKDVHFNTSSFSFKSLNTRGFATVANTRFMQLVDGMDNSSPALNFILGNLLGLNDVDAGSVEILPGASSALYGANAFNGIVFMNSRSPFAKEGISTYFKYGRTVQETAGDNPVYDFGIRAAKKFTDHFAAKANFSVLSATEWIANDRRDLTQNNSGLDFNPNYDGLNTYGDEVSTNIKSVGQSLANLGLIPAAAVNLLPNYNVARTGYAEQDLNSNKVESVKFDASLHFRPWATSESNFAKDIEIIAQHKLGTGNTIYQGANRYFLKNFYMDQTKLEVKSRNFFVRGYMTTEDAGNSYDMRFAAWNVNRAWKSDQNWFGQYAGAYIQATLAGQTPENAHKIARTTADTGRYLPGSPEYNAALASVIRNSDFTSGAKFVDQSKLYHTDVNYNFKDLIQFAEIQVGGSMREYVMNSEGTIFTDFDKPLRYSEYGMYTQLQKKMMEDRLKFTGSIRYDKSKNFDGNFSPRASLTYAAGADKQHNLRVSYQTGFRNPTTQDQYIGLDLGPFALIGSAPENLVRFSETVTASNGSDYTLNGNNAYYNSFTSASVQAFSATGDASLLEKSTYGLVKPEKVQAFEVGYRTNFEKTGIDINGYYNMYKDFINTANVIAPYYGEVGTPQAIAALASGDRRVYQVYTNSKADITSLGFGIGLNRKVGKFDLGASYNYSDFQFDEASDPSFEPGFNTPKHRVKGSFGSDKLFKNFGFNTNVRWNTEYLWQSSFVDAMVPENVVFDAQINYTIPFLRSVVKVGGANIGGKDYIQVPGAGNVGQQYYASWTINP